jgi:hypothetical protein
MPDDQVRRSADLNGADQCRQKEAAATEDQRDKARAPLLPPVARGTLKQRRFLAELPRAKDATQAAIRAGYSPTTADSLKRNGIVASRIIPAVEREEGVTFREVADMGLRVHARKLASALRKHPDEIDGADLASAQGSIKNFQDVGDADASAGLTEAERMDGRLQELRHQLAAALRVNRGGIAAFLERLDRICIHEFGVPFADLPRRFEEPPSGRSTFPLPGLGRR